MSTIDDSGTFMSRRAYHSKNYKQLPLRRIDIDSSHLPAKGRRSGRQDHMMNTQYIAKSPEPETAMSKLPLVKMKRFSDLVNFFYESRVDQKDKNMSNQKLNQNLKRQISSKQSYSSNRNRQKSREEGLREEERLFQNVEQKRRGLKLKIRYPGGKSKLERRYNSQLPNKLDMTEEIERYQTDFSKKQQNSDNKKLVDKFKQRTSINESKVKRTRNSVRDQSKCQQEDTTSLINPEQNFSGNFDVTIEKILQDYNIKNQKQLQKFLSEHQYLETVHKSTSHSKNILLGNKTPMSEYDKTYRQYRTIDPISFNASNYQCLPELHLKKSNMDMKTSNCWEFYQKPISSVPFNICETEEYSPLQQITYKTSYQHAFSQSKPKPKQGQLFKLNNQTFVPGSQFIGTTQYNKDFRQTNQKLINKSNGKLAISELEYNKMKNGNSHNTITTKGFQLLKTSYNQQFKQRESPYLQTSIIQQSEPGPKSQSIDNYKMPTAMYESSTFKSFQHEQLKNKKKPVTPWKYHLMCQLKALLAMDKQKKQKKQFL